MKPKNKKIVLSINGASGAIYAKLLINKLLKLQNQWQMVAIVMSPNAKINWELEIKESFELPDSMDFYEHKDFYAPFASGSAKYDTMIVCPCSMGFLARISQGISNDLATRAADVILKERRKLILAIRETPLNLIHIRNIAQITEAGAIICPTIPSFYSEPKTIEECLMTVVDRILDLAGFETDSFQWGEN